MRFHMGFSFRPKLSWLKWFLLPLLGLFAYFGIFQFQVVFAATEGVVSMVPSNTRFYSSSYGAEHIVSGQSVTSGVFHAPAILYSNPTSLEMDATINAFYFTIPAKNLCSSGRVTYKFIVLGNTSIGSSSNRPGQNFSITNVGYNYRASHTELDITNSGVQESNVWEWSVNIPNNTSANVQLGFVWDGGGYLTNVVLSSQWSYSCDYTLQDSTQDIISNDNSNTQAIIDSQNDINNSLTNDNVDGALDTGNSFFDNFTIDSSRGFSSIVVAPIRLVQNILTSGSQCSPLNINLTMKDDSLEMSNVLSVPCGDILWERAPSSINILWGTLIWGLLGYRVLVDMYRFINNSLNPEYSKEYLMDL